MTRRGWLLLAGAGAAGCRKGQRFDMTALLAPEIAGWRRTAVKPGAPDAWFRPAAQSVRQALEADYEGPPATPGAPGRLTVVAFEMTSPSDAFEAVQQSLSSGDRVSFSREGIFFEVRLSNADRKATHAFIRALEGPPPARQ